MRALVLAAGKGTRLRPLTDTLPKALVPVCGRPLLAHTLERLRDAGVREVVVNVHHLGDQIIDYLSSHDFGLPVKVSDERGCLLDTGGGLRRAAALFNASSEPILIHNVDILSNADLAAFCRSSMGAGASLLVSPRPSRRQLLFDADMRLVGWTNLDTGEVRPDPSLRPSDYRQFAFSGIHCFSPSLLPLMAPFGESFPIMDFYLSACASADIRGYVQPGLRLLDVGKQDTLLRAEAFLRGEAAPGG